MKIIKSILFTITLFFAFVSNIHASGLSARIEQPKSPTHSKNFQVDFVALDIEGRNVSVDCYIKPSGGVLSVYDSKSLIAGGSSGVCQVSESDISGIGVYELYVRAVAGSDVSVSETVSINFDDKSPGTPTSYTRETMNSCEYRIKFRTASDGGITNKVLLYRSDQSSYNADNSTKVSDLGIGSDTNGEFTNTVPDCNKKYYYSIRAFSSSGLGSEITGDPDAVVLSTAQPSSQSTTVAQTVKKSQVVDGDDSNKVTEVDSDFQMDSSSDGLDNNPSVLGDKDIKSATKGEPEKSDNTTTWIVVSVSIGLLFSTILALFLIRKYGNK